MYKYTSINIFEPVKEHSYNLLHMFKYGPESYKITAVSDEMTLSGNEGGSQLLSVTPPLSIRWPCAVAQIPSYGIKPHISGLVNSDLVVNKCTLLRNFSITGITICKG